MTPSLEESAKTFATVRRLGFALRRWVANSTPRFLFIFSLAGLLLAAGGYAYLSHLLTVMTQQTREHISELNLTDRELSYEGAIDAISSCLASDTSDVKLHAWYCEQAIAQYRRVSPPVLKARADEVVGMSAYLAMRDDVQRYLRGLKLDRLASEPPTDAENLLTLILSRTMETLCISAAVFVLILIYWFFRGGRRIV